jgi:hypothetical protein
MEYHPLFVSFSIRRKYMNPCCGEFLVIVFRSILFFFSISALLCKQVRIEEPISTTELGILLKQKGAQFFITILFQKKKVEKIPERYVMSSLRAHTFFSELFFQNNVTSKSPTSAYLSAHTMSACF